MDDKALLLSLGFARPSAREAAESFRQVFPGVAAREGGRVRAFDERTMIGLMLGQALCRNAPCKEAVRMAKLKRLLVSTRRPLSAIAAECGYRDPDALAHIFRKRFGTTMSDWRRSNGKTTP